MLVGAVAVAVAVTSKTAVPVVISMGNTSLDEFVDGRAGKTDEEDTESDPAEPQATGVDPATAVLRWSPDGGDCEACGRAVGRRWRSETGLVCAGCKEW